MKHNVQEELAERISVAEQDVYLVTLSLRFNDYSARQIF